MKKIKSKKTNMILALLAATALVFALAPNIAVGAVDDGDGVRSRSDNCPDIYNPLQEDADADGLGDACDSDDDNDTITDEDDNCPFAQNYFQEDSDEDGAGDACDNCPSDSNAGQADADSDEVGDVCDNCAAAANTGQADTDSDGEGDACDTDDDADGVSDGADNCPLVANTDQDNFDGDSYGDACDDSDGDGLSDAEEIAGVLLPTSRLTLTSNPAVTTLVMCDDSTPRDECLDPDEREALVIVVPLAASKLPSNMFEFIEKPIGEDGLEIYVHRLTATDSEPASKDTYRTIIRDLRAVWLQEFAGNPGYLGWGPQGPPTRDGVWAKVYTDAMEYKVNTGCGNAATCRDNGPQVGGVYIGADPGLSAETNRANLMDHLKRMIIAHEVGHNLECAVVGFDPSLGGFHYDPSKDWVMKQLVNYKPAKGGKEIIFQISDIYNPDSQDYSQTY